MPPNSYINRYNRLNDVLGAISNVTYEYGATHTASALRTMHSAMFTPVNGERPEVPDVAIVITDGQSNVNQLQTLPEARIAKHRGITIFAVGIGLQNNRRELDGIASPPLNSHVFLVDDFDDLQPIVEKIKNPVCKGI